MSEESLAPAYQRYALPTTRDPIVNTLLLPLGVNRQGVESFWISTYNRCTGCTGLRVDAWGQARAYRFPWQHEGFYSAVAVGEQTLWLCGRLDRVVRLDLRSGRYRAFATGVAKARVFGGMIYDPPTGKLLVASKPFQDKAERQPTLAVSFDTRACRTVRVHALDIDEGLSRVSFSNGDGTYSLTLQIPGESLLRWDPRTETVETECLSSAKVWTQDGQEKRTSRLIGDADGRRYFPERGWYHPIRRCVEDGPRPAREMTWFCRHHARILGVRNEGSDLSVHAWDPRTGTVDYRLTIPDCDVFNVNLTQSGHLVAVNTFGVFFRFDPDTGALESSRRLPTDGHGDALAVSQIDDARVIGGPYISPRFWELHLPTGAGRDCGRGGWGQINFMEKVNGRVYFGTYSGGELMEYQPEQPLCFPDNPRLVADPPGGMRPVACANDGRHLYYACTSDYGTLGSVVTRYDTVTGRACYAINPLGDQAIHSLVYDGHGRSLLCGTTFHADSMDGRPTASACVVAQLDATTLAVRQSATAPVDAALVSVIGSLTADSWLCGLHAHVSGPPVHWSVLRRGDFAAFSQADRRHFPADFRGGIQPAGHLGRFILNVEDRLELWDLRRMRVLRTLFAPFDPATVDGYLFAVQGTALIVLRSTELIYVADCLKED